MRDLIFVQGQTLRTEASCFYMAVGGELLCLIIVGDLCQKQMGEVHYYELWPLSSFDSLEKIKNLNIKKFQTTTAIIRIILATYPGAPDSTNSFIK